MRVLQSLVSLFRPQAAIPPAPLPPRDPYQESLERANLDDLGIGFAELHKTSPPEPLEFPRR